MSYQDHVKTCPDCQKRQRPTIRVKGASSYRREKKLSGLAALITGASYPGVLFVGEKKTKTKGASSQLERQVKLRELGKLVRGL